MRKINLLYVDDEMLFIRTVTRILQYNKNLRNNISITAAYHPYDAISQVEKSEIFFDIVMVDYRLEPDKSPEKELNGEKLANRLKDLEKCNNSFFVLLSATNKDVDPQFFTISLDKSSNNLRWELDHVFEEIFRQIKYPKESEKFTDEGCKFKGNNEDRKLLRYQINRCLKQQKSLLLYGTNRRDLSKLLKDIEQKSFIQFESSKKCYIVDLTASNCDFEQTIEYIENNKDNYLIIGFDKFDQLKSEDQEKLKEWTEEIGLPVVFVCNNLQEREIFEPLELICELPDQNILQLYEINNEDAK